MKNFFIFSIFIFSLASCSNPSTPEPDDPIVEVPVVDKPDPDVDEPDPDIDEPDPDAPARELIVCGDDKIIIIDEAASNGANVKIVWKWQASDAASQIPAAYQNRFANMDECKPVDGGKNILATSSAGAVVLIERETKKCLFYAYVPAAHSAAALPDGRIAVALSEHTSGNSLEIYDRNQPEKLLYKEDLYSGHGAVWNDKRQRLYALGGSELREYSLVNWTTSAPSLKLEKMWIIGDASGHDLYPVSDDELLISHHYGVQTFNISNETFAPFEPLKNTADVKSVNYIKGSQKLVYTRAEESWWTFNIYFQNPDKTIHIPEIKVYKVRLSY